MKFTATQDQSEELDINLTPLIDVVFLLLIFFMVSTTFVDTAGIQVALPKTSKAPEVSKQEEPLVIAIDAEGNVFYKENKTSPAEMAELFSALTGDSQQLVIRADTKATHGSVVEIMDIAQQNGISKISIAAESKLTR